MDFPSFSNSGIQLPIRPQGIAFDLDGTLLDYDGTLSDTVARAVRLFTSAGIKVFVVTGRPMAGGERYWRELDLDTPMACCNGAYVGFPGEVPFVHLRMSEKARNIILDTEEQHDLYVNYYIDNHIYSRHEGPDRDWYSRQFAPVERAVDREDIALRPLPTKCLCISSEIRQREVTELLSQALGDEAIVTQSNERFIELISPEANKGVGLQALADWAGIPVDRFIAVGDGLNDLPMLALAGFAITFKSGNKQLFDQVDMLLPPLWEDGMEILAKCVLGMTNSGRFLTPRSTRFFQK